MNAKFSKLCKQLRYQFKQEELLVEALTHRSAGKKNNERLEFLGDGILNFVIAAALYARSADSSEGVLSRLRATLVNGDRLAEVASSIGLGDHLILGSGELKSGGFRRASILADTLEAVFGAIYLDGGYNSARSVILALFAKSLKNLPDNDTLKDPKTRLQEYLQARQQPLPNYTVVDISGEAHNQTFTVSCSVSAIEDSVRGIGSSRRKAEQEAALKILEVLANE